MTTDALQAHHRPTECPRCGAAVRSGMSWCSLCFGAVGAADAEPTPADPVQAVAAATTDDPPASTDGSGPAQDVDALADRLLAQLAAEDADVLHGRAREHRSTGRTAALIAGGTLAGCLLLVVTLWVLGLLL